MISEAVLDAEVRIGTLTTQMQTSERMRTDLLRPNVGPQTKTQAVRDLGFSTSRIKRFETLARSPDVVEKAKAEARERDDIVSRAFVLQARAWIFTRQTRNIASSTRIRHGCTPIIAAEGACKEAHTRTRWSGKPPLLFRAMRLKLPQTQHNFIRGDIK